jgi:antitoxin component YwqK of YwqJK toxin-antitoxin module
MVPSYDSGQKEAEGNYVDGVKKGTWTNYYENGTSYTSLNH